MQTQSLTPIDLIGNSHFLDFQASGLLDLGQDFRHGSHGYHGYRYTGETGF